MHVLQVCCEQTGLSEAPLSRLPVDNVIMARLEVACMQALCIRCVVVYLTSTAEL